MKILFSDWMRELDSEAINKIGIPSIVLMENAASGAAEFISEQLPLEIFKRVFIVAGPGNNGGDGIAIGRKLFSKGYTVLIATLTDPENFTGDPEINFNIVKNSGIPFKFISGIEDFEKLMNTFSEKDSFIIDSIFGTGLSRPVKDSFFSEVIKYINNSAVKVFSVDVPSGSSEKLIWTEGVRVKADYTVSFQTLKISHLFPDYDSCTGKIRVVDIGIPHFLLDKKEFYLDLVEKRSAEAIIRASNPGDHKGVYGHLLVIAGSGEKPGAAVLSSVAALRSGAGLVTCTATSQNVSVITGYDPGIMTLLDLTPEELINKTSEFSAILAGPGIGQNANSGSIVKKLIREYKNPLILDADALNVIGDDSTVLGEKQGATVVITPHPKEFSRITGIEVKKILEKPYKFSREFSMKFNLITVLKSHRTVIATPTGRVYINETGNPGMATGGSGDVLSGIISGLIARTGDKFDIEEIVKAAVFLHGFAGDMAAEELGETGMTASDILDFLPYSMKRIDDFESEFEFR